MSVSFAAEASGRFATDFFWYFAGAENSVEGWGRHRVFFGREFKKVVLRRESNIGSVGSEVWVMAKRRQGT